MSMKELRVMAMAKEITLPAVRELPEGIREPIRQYARLQAEHHLLSNNPGSGKRFAEYIDPKTGRLASSRGELENELREVAERHELDVSKHPFPSIMYVRLLEKMRPAYQEFMRENGLGDTEEAYGVFLLGVQHEYRKEADAILKETQGKGVENLRMHLNASFPRPYNAYVPVSNHSNHKGPINTLDPNGHPFLELLKIRGHLRGELPDAVRNALAHYYEER